MPAGTADATAQPLPIAKGVRPLTATCTHDPLAPPMRPRSHCRSPKGSDPLSLTPHAAQLGHVEVDLVQRPVGQLHRDRLHLPLASVADAPAMAAEAAVAVVDPVVLE